MPEEQKTAADVERVLHALRRERAAHQETERMLRQLQSNIMERVEALEAEPAAPPPIATVTSGLAAIRADLRAELASLRQELTDLADELHAFIRHP